MSGQASAWQRAVHSIRVCSGIAVLVGLGAGARADLDLSPAEYVAAGGNPIVVPGFSVPTFVFWKTDALFVETGGAKIDLPVPAGLGPSVAIGTRTA